MYSLTPWLGRAGLEDRPTTAIVLYLVRISKIGSALGDAPSGSKIFIAWSARFCRALGEQAAHHREQLLIFCRDTHGHAQRLREAHPAKRPHDDTVVQQFVTKLLRLRPYLDENKIGVAAHGAQSKLAHSFGESRSLDGVFPDRAIHVLGIIERGKGCRLAHAGEIEGRAQPVHRFEHRRVADAVADT